MSAIATFGICLAIAIVLLLLLAGSPIALLILIFPLLIAETITGERSMFAPNGGSGRKKSILFQVIKVLGFLAEALIVASIFYGIYGIFWGWPGAGTITVANKVSISLSQRPIIFTINKILLMMISYFTIMFTYHSIIHRERFKVEKDFLFFTNHILPFIAFVFGFTYLIGCYFYLLHLQCYPKEIHLGFIFKISGILYISYILYTMGRTFYFLSYGFRSESSGLRLKFWLRTTFSFVYYGLFIYFSYQIYTA